MLEIVVAGLLTYVVGTAAMVTSLRITRRAAVVGFGCVTVLLVLASLNFELSVVDPKVASTYAFDEVIRPPGSQGHTTFAVQGWLNFPAFLLTNVWWAAIGTNCGLVALAVVWIHSRDSSLTPWFLGPSVINFCLFGLRDPVIGVLVMILTVDAVRRPRHIPSLLALASYVALGISRPELGLVFVAARLVVGVLASSGGPRRLLMVPVLIVMLFVGLQFAPQTVGLEASSDPLAAAESLDDFMQSRTQRHIAAREDGSHILGGRLIDLPAVVRFPVQVVTFFVLPLPFEIRSATLALAFLDSLWFAWFLLRHRNRMSMSFLVILALTVVSVAFFADNYGNLLRLRMPLYFAAAATFALQPGVPSVPIRDLLRRRLPSVVEEPAEPVEHVPA